MATIPRPLSGRRAEREALQAALTSDRAEFVAIYYGLEKNRHSNELVDSEVTMAALFEHRALS